MLMPPMPLLRRHYFSYDAYAAADIFVTMPLLPLRRCLLRLMPVFAATQKVNTTISIMAYTQLRRRFSPCHFRR